MSDKKLCYFLTAICSEDYQSKNLTNRLVASRTFGYYFDKREAVEAITRNTGNMVECLYDYLVLEHIGPGVHAICEKESWFRWDEYYKEWRPEGRPDWVGNSVNFALG